MAIFYTDTGSFGEVTISGSSFQLLLVSGTAGAIFEVNNSPGSSEVLSVSSASAEFLKINNDYTTIISGSLTVTNNVFSRGGTISDYTNGITNNQWYAVWRCPFSCSVTAMYGLRDGGTTAQINARRSGSTGYSLHTGSNLTLTTQDVWTAVNSVQNVSYVAGDSLEIIISGSGGSPNQVSVQVDFVRV